MVKVCANCGGHFEVESSEFWKTRCLPCFLRRKATESDGTRRPPATLVRHARPDVAQENAALRQRVARLRGDIDELEKENQQLLCDLREVVGRLHRAGNLANEFYEQLPRLIQLAHPDRHGGSLAAQRATQWLLHMRQSAPALIDETEEVVSP